jgi:hypothetical protein
MAGYPADNLTQKRKGPGRSQNPGQGRSFFVCPNNTPHDGEKSIAEALWSARSLYGVMCRTKRVYRGARPTHGETRFRGEIPKVVHFREEFHASLDGLISSWTLPWLELRRLIPYLIALACEGQEWTKGWLGPGWLIGFPKELEEAAVLAGGERLDTDETKELLRAVRNYARQRLKGRRAVREAKERVELLAATTLRPVKGTARRGKEENATAVPAWDELKKRKSVFQWQAAQYFGWTDRAIRKLFAERRLTKAPSGRVVCDDKLLIELRKVHGLTYR